MLRAPAAALSILLSTALSLPAQDPAPVTESAEAVLVEVPVRVTDRHGNPIHGLEAKDFEVYDDGKKQEIVAVDAIELGKKEVAPGEPAPIHPAARRHFLILFDFSFAQAKSILAAQRAAKEFVLNGISDDDFVAVATYTVEHGLRLLVTFSSDRVQLARAIDTMGLDMSEQVSKDPLSFAFDIGRMNPTGSNLGQKESQAAAIAETIRTLASISRARADTYLRSRVRRLTESLSDLASVLDSVQGRKDIVYLSEGFESRLVTGTRDSEEEREWIISGEQWKVDGEKRFGNPTLKEDLRLVGQLFRRSDCVLHAVDIAGLKLDPETTSVDVTPSENSLFELAEPTGGEVLRSGNDFKAQFRRLLTSTSLVYVLAFRPERTGGEARYHELKVKVRPKGAHVLARAGYYERPAFKMLSPLEKSLLAADVIANEIPLAEIPARLRASPLPNEGGPARVPIVIEAGGPELLAKQTAQRLPVEIYVYAHDDKGHLTDFLTQTVSVDLGIHRERIARGGMRYCGQLTLAPGEYRVRALVRNGLTGRMGLAAETVRVPDFSRHEPYLAPPLFLERAPTGLFVRGKVGDAAGTPGERIAWLTRTGASPSLVPTALPEVHSGSESPVSVVAYWFGEQDAADLKIGAQVLSEEGRPLGEGTIRVLEQTPEDSDGRKTLVVAFTPTSLSPGRYSLRVFLRDDATGRGGHASAPFLVR